MGPHLTGALERLVSLKAWLAEVAHEHNLPAFVIFHDATLRDLAEWESQSVVDLDGISGVGAKKKECAYLLRYCRLVDS